MIWETKFCPLLSPGGIFETVLLLILKSGYSNPWDTLNLLLAHPLYAHLASAVVHLYDCDFTWLHDYNFDWTSQTMISKSKFYAFLACLIHFYLDTSLLMQYLDNNYTGACRNTHMMIKSLQHYNIKHVCQWNHNWLPKPFCCRHVTSNVLHYW